MSIIAGMISLNGKELDDNNKEEFTRHLQKYVTKGNELKQTGTQYLSLYQFDLGHFSR
jgi:hypothetical protein